MKLRCLFCVSAALAFAVGEDLCEGCESIERCVSSSAITDICDSCDVNADCEKPMEGMNDECATCGENCTEWDYTAEMELRCDVYCVAADDLCVYNEEIKCEETCQKETALDCLFDCRDKGCLYDEEQCSCTCDCERNQGYCGYGCAPMVCRSVPTEPEECDCQECTVEDCETACDGEQVCRSLDGQTCRCTSCECLCIEHQVCREITEGECECVLECEGHPECLHCDGQCQPVEFAGSSLCMCLPEPTCDEDSCNPACIGDEVCQLIDDECQCAPCACGCAQNEVCREITPGVCGCILECDNGHPVCDACIGNCIPGEIGPLVEASCICVPTTTEEPCTENSCDPSCGGFETCQRDYTGECRCLVSCACVAPTDCECGMPTDEVAGGEDDEEDESVSVCLSPVLSVTAFLFVTSL